MIKNNNKGHLQVFAAYIRELYLKEFNCELIYNDLNNYYIENNHNMIVALEKIYNKYQKNIKVSKKKFINLLNNLFSEIIKSNIGIEGYDFESIMQNFQKLTNKKSYFNFQNITYPLFLFTKNLYFSLIRDEAKKVYFFAREGQFLKKLFEHFQSSVAGPKIKAEYLYVSRAATFLGTLDSLEKESFTALFTQYPNMSLCTFCKNLSFTDEEINKLEKELGFILEFEIENVKDSKEFKKLVQNKYFRNKYDEKRNESKNAFISYLNEFGTDYQKELFIVDVGWKGTIQNNIQKMLPKTFIKGYYLGLVHYANIVDYEKKEAVLFENSLERKTLNGYLYNSNRSIFEVILAANHGSTINYKKDGDKVIPILNNQEKEKALFENRIKKIQENIYNEFIEIVKILNSMYFDNNIVEKIINNKFFELMFKPKKSEIEEYNSFYHFENFGVMNYSYFKKNNNISLKQKIKNYYHFKAFIQNDDSWQYLKLNNNNMKLGKIALYLYKKRNFKNMNIL